MSEAELNLESGMWLMLFVQKRISGWPVSELMATLYGLVDNEQIAPYLAPGAEDKFRRFVRKRDMHFHYNAEEDTVALTKDSPSIAADQWLVTYIAQQIQASEGSLEIGTETSARCQSAVPKCMADHMKFVYNGDLELFLRTHPTDFTIDESCTRARLPLSFHEESIAAFAKEENLVFFFIDLLQKIGATKAKPCFVHTLTKYLHFMKSAERKLLQEKYRSNLNVFFLLNPGNFATSKPERGSVFVKNHDPDYGLALFLKQQVNILTACTPGQSVKVSLAELASRAKYSSSPIAGSISGVKSVGKKLRDIAQRHPAMFHVDEQGEKLWLREEHPPWPEGQCNVDNEFLAVAYFIDVLKHVDATSPSRAICFNYIVRASAAAPQNCKDYLESIYPALEVIGLFHLHPGIFDLCSVNRVCLKTTEEASDTEAAPADTETKSSPDSAEKKSVLYVAKLLKYVRDLNPDLLAMCMESVSADIRSYCIATVKGRLQSVIDRGKAALLSAERTQLLKPTRETASTKTTSNASTQTVAEPTSLPVTYEPVKEGTSKEKKTAQDHAQKGTVPRVLQSKTAKKKAKKSRGKRKKKAAKKSPANENLAQKVPGATASPESSSSTGVCGTKEPLKVDQEVGLSEQVQAVGGQNTGGKCLALLERLAKLSPEHLEAEASAKSLPHVIKKGEIGKTSKAASKITLEVSKVTVYTPECP